MLIGRQIRITRHWLNSFWKGSPECIYVQYQKQFHIIDNGTESNGETIEPLTRWPLGNAAEFLNYSFSYNGKYIEHLLWSCPEVNATRPHWQSVNIVAGNGLVPSGNKPLPGPMLTTFYDAIRPYSATVSWICTWRATIWKLLTLGAIA